MTDEEQQAMSPRPGLFIVRRSSYCDTQPCEGAFLAPAMRVDIRSFDDPKKIPANNGTDGDWYQRGENHRVENGHICRDLGYQDEWFVEIDSIMDFVDKHGDCIVGREHRGFATIEIYDSYRE